VAKAAFVCNTRDTRTCKRQRAEAHCAVGPG